MIAGVRLMQPVAQLLPHVGFLQSARTSLNVADVTLGTK
jgi:hypothetical protein